MKHILKYFCCLKKLCKSLVSINKRSIVDTDAHHGKLPNLYLVKINQFEILLVSKSNHYSKLDPSSFMQILSVVKIKIGHQ